MQKFITIRGQKVPIKKGLSVTKFKGLRSNQLLVSKDGDINTKSSISDLLSEGIKAHEIPRTEQNGVIKHTVSYHRVYTVNKKASGWDKSARWTEVNKHG